MSKIRVDTLEALDLGVEKDVASLVEEVQLDSVESSLQSQIDSLAEVTPAFTNAEDYGFSVSGTAADNALAINTAISSSGDGATVLVPAYEDYECDRIDLQQVNKNLVFLGKGWALPNSTTRMFIEGEYTNLQTVTDISDSNVTVDSSAGVTTTRLTVASVTGYSKGDVVKIVSNAIDPYHGDTDRRIGAYHTVIAVDEGNNYIHLQRDLDDDFQVSDNTRIAKLQPYKVKVKGFKVRSTRDITNIILQMQQAYKPEVNIEVDTHGSLCVNNYSSYYAEFKDCRFTNLKTDAGTLGYGINDISSYGTKIIDIHGKFARHITTTNFNSVAADSNELDRYGACRGHTVIRGIAEACQGASFDSHPGSRGDSWIDCKSYLNIFTTSSASAAFQVRGLGGRIVNGEAYGRHETFVRVNSRISGKVDLINPYADNCTLIEVPDQFSGQKSTDFEVWGGTCRQDSPQTVLQCSYGRFWIHGTRFIVDNWTASFPQIVDADVADVFLDNPVFTVAAPSVGGANGVRVLRTRGSNAAIYGRLSYNNPDNVSFARLYRNEATAGHVVIRSLIYQGPSVSSATDNASGTIFTYKIVRTVRDSPSDNEHTFTDSGDYIEFSSYL